jgi:hypothetical protein
VDGWVSVSRKLTEHWLWEDRPFTRGQAWIDLILLVNHEDNEFLHGNQITIVKRGSRITSIKKLADRWGWSRKKVFDFLNVLEKEQMLVKNSNTKETLVTIVKYEDYQNSRNTKETQKKHRGNTTETPKSTNNNENNDNNILPKGNKEYSTDQLLNQAILDFIEFRKSKEIKSPLTEHGIDLLIANLKKLSPDTSEQIAILNQSIVSGWKGIFELKKKIPPQDKSKPTNNKQLQYPQRAYTAEDYADLEKKLINKGL